MPSLGLRQAHSSCLKCGQMNTASKSIPCEANSSRMKRCARSNFSLGRLGVPSPSWLVTMTKAKPARFKFQQRRHDSRHQADLLQAVHLLVGRFLVEGAVPVQKQRAPAAHAASRLSSSASFCMRVPTEMRSDARQRRIAAHVAHDRAAGHARAHEAVGIAAIDQEKVRIARPHLLDQARFHQALSQILALGEQGVDPAARRARFLRRERAQRRFDGGLRQRVGRDDAPRQLDQLRVGYQRADARAGQGVRLRQGAQNGER